jgi:hypothetical protein
MTASPIRIVNVMTISGLSNLIDVWISLAGIPGAFVAMYTVDIKHVGRKGVMAISGVGSAICLALFAKLEGAGGQLAANCVQSFLQNIFYAVLYAYRYPPF